jgi:branched-chain amino acid transport system permease protein
MLKNRLQPASIAALVTFLLAFPIIGMRLTKVDVTSELAIAHGERLWLILAAVSLVFVVQLFRPPIDQFVHTIKLVFFSRHASYSNRFQAYTHKQKWINIGFTLLIISTVCFPFIFSRGSVDLATLVLIYIMLGLGLNIVVGLAGLLDLGYVAFYAVGAYSYALLNQYFGFSFWESLPISGLLAGTFGFILGFPVLRLRGDYLAIVTLGFGEIIRILLNNLSGLTGGPDGISGIPKPTLFGLEFSRHAKVEGNIPFHEFFHIEYNSGYKVIFLYLLALLLVFATLFVISRLRRMPIGRAWEALREDEIACRSLGLNRTLIKLSAFTLGATFAGFAGAFFAARQGFISPESFTFIESAIILAIVVLGGMGSQFGIILAAIALTVLPELAREFQSYRMLVFGLMMVLMMIWRPQGLLPSRRPHLELTNE